MSNSSNYSEYGNLTKNDAWKESGAMVYVAMTITVLSSLIMCCVWFVKRKVYKKGYGVVVDEDRVELPGVVDPFVDEVETAEEIVEEDQQPASVGAVGQSDKDTAPAYTLEGGSSSEEEVDLGLEHAV
jgi:hypothetical protein